MIALCDHTCISCHRLHCYPVSEGFLLIEVFTLRISSFKPNPLVNDSKNEHGACVVAQRFVYAYRFIPKSLKTVEILCLLTYILYLCVLPLSRFVGNIVEVGLKVVA